MQTIDLRTTEASGWLKEEGIYNGVISGVREKNQTSTGALQTLIDCKDSVTGLMNTVYLTWTTDNMGRNKADLMVLGLDLDNQVFDPNVLVGIPIRFECKFGIDRNKRDAMGQVIPNAKSDFLSCTILGRNDGNVAVSPAPVASTHVQPMEQQEQPQVASAIPGTQVQGAQPTQVQYEQPQAQPQGGVAPAPQTSNVIPGTQYTQPTQAQAPANIPGTPQPQGGAQPQVVQPQVQQATTVAPATNIPGLHV